MTVITCARMHQRDPTTSPNIIVGTCAFRRPRNNVLGDGGAGNLNTAINRPKDADQDAGSHDGCGGFEAFSALPMTVQRQQKVSSEPGERTRGEECAAENPRGECCICDLVGEQQDMKEDESALVDCLKLRCCWLLMLRDFELGEFSVGVSFARSSSGMTAQGCRWMLTSFGRVAQSFKLFFAELGRN